MAGAKRFEDLLMWQRARALANIIYKLTEQASFRDASLRNQMRRAAVSVMSNIAEGFGRGSNEELLHFLYISKGSIAELQSQLYLALDRSYIPKPQFEEAMSLADETARMIQAFAKSMKSAGRGSFRRRKEVVPWRDRVEKTMREITGGTRQQED